MNPDNEVDEVEVAVVGGGPVGLVVGLLLEQLGVSFVVLERRTERLRHSRSIGIHPPALELFARLGLVGALLARGVRVPGGAALGGTPARMQTLGRLDFSHCPPPYRFVLSLPQSETERVLEDSLCTRRPGALWRGAEVVGLSQQQDRVTLGYHRQGEHKTLRARFVVGCDGKKSIVRGLAGIAFAGGPYRDHYLMGDFADTTPFGAAAALYLLKSGIVESFPLPGGVRRWVLKTPDATKEDVMVSAEVLAALVQARTGQVVAAETNTMLSAFGVERYLAARFVRGRVVLAGDAAHVLSPIGGQGMNLGWLDAQAFVAVLGDILSGRVGDRAGLRRYQQTRRKAARRAIRRAAFNTRMGRESRLVALRTMGVRLLLRTPLRASLAKVFTMRGL